MPVPPLFPTPDGVRSYSISWLTLRCTDCGRVRNARKFRDAKAQPCRFCGDVWRRYRITGAEVFRTIDEQRGGCAICEKPFGLSALDRWGQGPKVFHIDHKKGMERDARGVRGILCLDGCNPRLFEIETQDGSRAGKGRAWRLAASAYIEGHEATLRECGDSATCECAICLRVRRVRLDRDRVAHARRSGRGRTPALRTTQR